MGGSYPNTLRIRQPGRLGLSSEPRFVRDLAAQALAVSSRDASRYGLLGRIMIC